MAKVAENAKLKVIARAPFHVYYEGEANVLSARNRVGPFDVLPGHADFFSVLTPGEIIIETDEEALSFDASNGIVAVRNDEVMLFVNF